MAVYKHGMEVTCNRYERDSNAVAIAKRAQPIAEPFSFYRVHNELTEVSRVSHLPDCVYISNTNCSLL